MKLHANARTCPNSRRLLVERIEERDLSVAAAAEAASVTERTAYRWLRRLGRREPEACSTARARPGASRTPSLLTGSQLCALSAICA